MIWDSHVLKNFPWFVVIYTVKGFSIVNEAEVDAFLEFSCFFYDPANVGNLVSGSSAFSKTSLNIWKFTVHVLLKPGLEAVAATAQELQMSYPTSKVRGGGQEELPLIQGKEQWLCFAGAAMKRYPISKVRGAQVRR